MGKIPLLIGTDMWGGVLEQPFFFMPCLQPTHLKNYTTQPTFQSMVKKLGCNKSLTY